MLPRMALKLIIESPLLRAELNFVPRPWLRRTHPGRWPGRCPVQDKIRWMTQRDAENALINLGSENVGRVYQCPACHSWHITRKPDWRD